MANYGLYKNIDPDTLSSAASSIKEDASSRVKAITNLNNSLSDGIWKCNAKNTLKEGLNKINGEVMSDINSSLTDLVTVAGYIKSYKSAEQKANGIKNTLASTPNTEENASTISSLKSNLTIAEGEMEKCESQVREML